MAISEMLYTLIIGPLRLLFETIFMVTLGKNNYNVGGAIIVLSLAINVLILPLYRRADAMQEEERRIEDRLRDGVKHIKQTFKGDERTMILQEYYRRNNYRPTDVIKGSVSLFLEIPFFIAAYSFLSEIQILNGVPFGPISDLSAPDAMVTIFGIPVNVLPIIMTVVNIVSCVIFTKGHPLKTKIQLYAMAVFFLFFLYSSPSGLVLYWTLNNIFSLGKTLVYKINDYLKKKGVLDRSKKKGNTEIVNDTSKWRKLTLWGLLYLTLFLGIVIPSFVIKSSPQEFVNIQNFLNPMWFVVSSLLYAIGTFLIWVNVFCALLSKKWDKVKAVAISILCFAVSIDYMFFGNEYGILNNVLKYENALTIELKSMLINLSVLVVLAVLVAVLVVKFNEPIKGFIKIACMALAVMSVVNIVIINNNISAIKENISFNDQKDEVHFTLSRNEKNVVVIMLDRSIGGLIPYIMNERPDLMDKFSGFTFYPNTLSFGTSTNTGSPALFGGYEYTPKSMNERATDSLETKQNEALRVMPCTFDDAGYKVTVFDPIYAGYQYVPDLSIYNDHPEIDSYVTNGYFTDESSFETFRINNMRNFFCYSIFKSAPVVLHRQLYNRGMYNRGDSGEGLFEMQVQEDRSKAQYFDLSFLNAYRELDNLPKMTKISDDGNGAFFMMVNDVTHEPILLKEPEYVPAFSIDNEKFDKENEGRFTLNGTTIKTETGIQMAHYHANMAALLKLSEWLDYLKKEKIYDNTRIIICADHGRGIGIFESLILDDRGEEFDLAYYNPTLLVKDFNACGKLCTSEELMTNADVPSLAFEDIIKIPVNPSTGKEITNKDKYEDELYVFGSMEWTIESNHGNRFNPGTWFLVHDDIRDKSNWSIVIENAEMPY